MSGWVGFQLSDDGVKTLGVGFHYGIGLSVGALYIVLRRGTSLGPLTAGLLAGLILWAGVDEGVNSLLGFSAPIDRYPLGTHIRGLASHVVLVQATAVSAEILSKVLRRSRTP